MRRDKGPTPYIGGNTRWNFWGEGEAPHHSVHQQEAHKSRAYLGHKLSETCMICV